MLLYSSIYRCVWHAVVYRILYTESHYNGIFNINALTLSLTPLKDGPTYIMEYGSTPYVGLTRKNMATIH
jgi:hypothetical protein